MTVVWRSWYDLIQLEPIVARWRGHIAQLGRDGKHTTSIMAIHYLLWRGAVIIIVATVECRFFFLLFIHTWPFHLMKVSIVAIEVITSCRSILQVRYVSESPGLPSFNQTIIRLKLMQYS